MGIRATQGKILPRRSLQRRLAPRALAFGPSSFFLLALLLFLTPGLWLFLHFERLIPFFLDDGPMDWVSVLLALAVAGGSLAAALRLRGSREPYRGWLLLGVLSFALAGDELDWGQRLFHLQAPVILGREIRSLHDSANLSLDLLAQLLGGKRALAMLLLIVAGAALAGVATLLARRKETRVRLLRAMKGWPSRFVLLGLVLMFLGQVLDSSLTVATLSKTQHFGGPMKLLTLSHLYEETLEVLALVAFLYALAFRRFGALRQT